MKNKTVNDAVASFLKDLNRIAGAASGTPNYGVVAENCHIMREAILATATVKKTGQVNPQLYLATLQALEGKF